MALCKNLNDEKYRYSEENKIKIFYPLKLLEISNKINFCMTQWSYGFKQNKWSEVFNVRL